MADLTLNPPRRPLIVRYPSVAIFMGLLALFTLGVTVLAEGFGIGVISTSFVKTLGKTLCLCLVALAMDLVWGYTGILSLGHMAFFGIGGYAIGMWLMYARTEIIVTNSLASAPLPPTPQEISDGIATQIFGVQHRDEPGRGPEMVQREADQRPDRYGAAGLRAELFACLLRALCAGQSERLKGGNALVTSDELKPSNT